ncbi:MAG: peptide chain release factor aRF-1 [Candidatus Methanomethylophilaceae archaeon]|jgi:peptide chain release factor subunit 1|nr:peptide chain release factor aRF-1 [Candidatus Methanomethylophilaceae archaeon]NCA74273.1 peptide chain release factor 1 [Gammaproteobacteria bacterium]MDD2935897.1 peptide chain release factor aRF-1 [Candidatus Methanomethylophilaceae archaeon]MDD3351380.1 peptide chain release factor aRF-1 [Candidatus Methanomethylophilaceae archaeon]MDD3986752.1 peptide chain release factor aRF-1 [Candidatus Methanomethylophilaceae archaeon]
MGDSSTLDRARYDFKKAMQEITQYRGRGTELISVYVPESKQISDVMSYLREEQSQASNIKSKTTMKNVTSAIDSIASRLKTYKSPPPNGLVIFCGEVPRAGDQTKMVQYTVVPPEPITAFLYRCDSSFFTETLEAMLLDKTSYGLITIDRREATIGIVSGSRISILKHFDSLVPSKHHQGGQSSVRFERLIEIAAHEFYKKVAEYCTEAFLDKPELKGIVVGGPGATKDFFVKEEYLHHELRKKIVSPLFDTGNTDESGIRELVEMAKDAMEGIKLTEEKKHVQRLLDEIRKPDGGLSAYGYSDVRAATEAGAVETLLISEALDKRHITLECQSGHVTKEVVASSEGKHVCGECGQSAQVIEDNDLVDEFFEMAEGFGTSLQIISPESEEGDMLVKAFGGIAAILRYKLS